MGTKFTIDFFQFSFLVEACIPEKPIARTMFFNDVSDKYYHQMTKDERIKLFNWIQLNPNFDLKKKDCEHFHARFNPDNQFLVKTKYDGKEEAVECYLYKDEYHKNKTTSIIKEFITNVEVIL